MHSENQFRNLLHRSISCAATASLTLAIAFALTVVATQPAQAQMRKTVTVSSFASGNFGAGYARQTQQLPLVEALRVTSPGMFTMTYMSGTWCAHDGTACSGPNGTAINDPSGAWYDPLQEASGLYMSASTNAIALMGAFVPLTWANTPGFQALDGTKLTSGVGIMPNQLFFVGANNYLQVSGPGILYLGINDWYVDDNSGSLTVTVIFTGGR